MIKDQGARRLMMDDGIKSASKGQGREGGGDTAHAKQAGWVPRGKEEAIPSVTRAKTRPSTKPCGGDVYLRGMANGWITESTSHLATCNSHLAIRHRHSAPTVTAYICIAHAQRSTDCHSESTTTALPASRGSRKRNQEKKKVQDSFRLTARAGG